MGSPHFIEIDGRRWRATDPGIPEPFRKELVDELMRARRSIGVLLRAGDEDLLDHARAQVHAAKVALGERGEPWWEPPSEAGQLERIEATILALAGHRAPDKTICPSDVARAIGGTGWRALVPQVREVARRLATERRVVVTQGGHPLDPDAPWKGPVRIRLTLH
ncbi:DUF3253 domain-containing protein [Aquihabitans daechungensis]|uniref:DUF3253 domain-containing protein n=1 Tax=Aquihabitans daechungensis TaxID=1052257 RepID=UPI003B9F4FE9